MSVSDTPVPVIPGLSKYVTKIKPNVYNVAGNQLTFMFKDRRILIRIGGGFVDFYQWCAKHQSKLIRYITVQENQENTDEGKSQGNEESQGNDDDQQKRPAMVLRSKSRFRSASQKSVGALEYNAQEYLEDSVTSPSKRQASFTERKKNVEETEVSNVTEKLLKESEAEIERVSSVLDAEKMRQEQKLQQEIMKRKETNEILSLKVQLETIKAEKDDALIDNLDLKRKYEKQAQEMRILKQDLEKQKLEMEKQKQSTPEPTKQQDGTVNVERMKGQINQLTSSLQKLKVEYEAKDEEVEKYKKKLQELTGKPV
eukprot:c21480_g1_i5.p1 GENE.c21480_g1_i5~~c21480_g1_i5.p1  ORF type:complete len:313 (+),score=124.72 c21480_g1_i5:33-971(+)